MADNTNDLTDAIVYSAETLTKYVTDTVKELKSKIKELKQPRAVPVVGTDSGERAIRRDKQSKIRKLKQQITKLQAEERKIQFALEYAAMLSQQEQTPTIYTVEAQDAIEIYLNQAKKLTSELPETSNTSNNKAALIGSLEVANSKNNSSRNDTLNKVGFVDKLIRLLHKYILNSHREQKKVIVSSIQKAEKSTRKMHQHQRTINELETRRDQYTGPSGDNVNDIAAKQQAAQRVAGQSSAQVENSSNKKTHRNSM